MKIIAASLAASLWLASSEGYAQTDPRSMQAGSVNTAVRGNSAIALLVSGGLSSSGYSHLSGDDVISSNNNAPSMGLCGRFRYDWLLLGANLDYRAVNWFWGHNTVTSVGLEAGISRLFAPTVEGSILLGAGAAKYSNGESYDLFNHPSHPSIRDATLGYVSLLAELWFRRRDGILAIGPWLELKTTLSTVDLTQTKPAVGDSLEMRGNYRMGGHTLGAGIRLKVEFDLAGAGRTIGT